MSGADRYQEAGQHLADFAHTGNPNDLAAAHVQALLAVAAATVLPLVVQHMGDTDAIADWAKRIAPDIRWPGEPVFEPAHDEFGGGLWLDPSGEPKRLAGPAPEAGWRRLYVQVGGESQ